MWSSEGQKGEEGEVEGVLRKAVSSEAELWYRTRCVKKKARWRCSVYWPEVMLEGEFLPLPLPLISFSFNLALIQGFLLFRIVILLDIRRPRTFAYRLRKLGRGSCWFTTSVARVHFISYTDGQIHNRERQVLCASKLISQENLLCATINVHVSGFSPGIL